jgi:hypothetical protein
MTTRRTPIAVGSHLVSPRLLYSHHGIYVGRGKVVHYSGKADGLQTGPVKIDSLGAFAGGHGFRLKTHPNAKYAGKAVAARALLRLGEDLYSLIGNNCEHFCEWCINEQHRSLQVERGMQSTGSGVTAALMARSSLPAALRVLGMSGIIAPPLAVAAALVSIGVLAVAIMRQGNEL